MSRNKFYSSQEFKFQGLWSHEEAIAHGVDVGGKPQFTSSVGVAFESADSPKQALKENRNSIDCLSAF